MNSSFTSLPISRLAAIAALSTAVFTPLALADSGDRGNLTRQVSSSAHEAQSGRDAAVNSPLVLSSARLASDLRGRDIYNPQGEKIGSIGDVIVDINSGHAPYVVVGSGEVLGMGGSQRAVPIGALNSRMADGKKEGFTITVSSDLWEQVPIFERDNLSQLENEIAGRNLHNLFGQTWAADLLIADSAKPSALGVNPPDRGRKQPGETRSASAGTDGAMARKAELVLASDMTGKALMSAERKVGTIDDIVLASEGTRAAILLDPAPELTQNGRKYVVPFARVTLGDGEGYATGLLREDFSAMTEAGSEAKNDDGMLRLWPISGGGGFDQR